jgi:hypothetical protein
MSRCNRANGFAKAIFCIHESMLLFHVLSIASIALALVCALVIAVDLVRRPQKMAVMNAVWPATALYGSVFALWFYWRKGRAAREQAAHHSMHGHMGHGDKQAGEHSQAKTPTPAQVTLATSHCGAGCALADICVEFAVFGFALTLFGSSLWASFVYDFIAAWGLGIVFQYYSIKPMRDISAGGALLAAIKADTLSILSFQIGMYAWMAVVHFWLFSSPHLEANQPEYWLMMQVAMLLGFATAWPMNRFLVSAGVKEAM